MGAYSDYCATACKLCGDGAYREATDRSLYFHPTVSPNGEFCTAPSLADYAEMLAKQLAERPACAAMRNSGGPVEIILTGKRHDNCIKAAIILGLDAKRFEQGFMTTRGRFVSREDAMRLARAAGMGSAMRHDGRLVGDVLFSEDLY